MKTAAHYQTLEYARMRLVLEQLAKDHERPLRILDFGCGRGKYMQQIRDQGHVVVGVDANPNYVDEGKQAGFQVLAPDEYFASADTYDVVLLSHLVEHLESNTLVDLFPKLCKSLKVGGRIIVITPLLGERFFHDVSHIRPYYPQSMRHAFGQENAPLLFGGVKLIELTDIYFFKDPFKTRTWRSFYVQTSPWAPITRAINSSFDWLWRASGGRVGVKASWLGVYRVLSG